MVHGDILAPTPLDAACVRPSRRRPRCYRPVDPAIVRQARSRSCSSMRCRGTTSRTPCSTRWVACISRSRAVSLPSACAGRHSGWVSWGSRREIAWRSSRKIAPSGRWPTTPASRQQLPMCRSTPIFRRSRPRTSSGTPVRSPFSSATRRRRQRLSPSGTNALPCSTSSPSRRRGMPVRITPSRRSRRWGRPSTTRRAGSPIAPRRMRWIPTPSRRSSTPRARPAIRRV